MKLCVVRDRSGKVVASYERGTGAELTLTPVLNEGERVEEIEVADNYKENVGALYGERKMKLNVVRDKSGKVVATFEAAVGNGAALKPVLNDGERLEEIEVAENYKETLSALYSDRSS